MVAYKFKTDQEKDIFKAFIYEKQFTETEEVDMFDFNKCNAVRITINGDLHLLKDTDYRSIKLIEDLNMFILMCQQ